MKRSIITMAALTFSLALLMPLASTKAMTAGPVAQDAAKEEADAYGAWYAAYKAQPSDPAKILELGKAFVQKFPSSKYADFIKKDFAREYGILFNQAVQAKNTAEIIRIGKEVLATDPENLDYLIALSIQTRQNELFATPPNFAHSADAADFTDRAIKLMEGGKVPAGAGDKFNKNVTLGYMHQTLAVIAEHDKNADKTMAEYEKAAALDPANATYFFHCGRLHNDKYAAAAQKYQAIPEADRDAAEPKPEVKAALEELNKQADAVITCWARFLGLTAGKPEWPAETRGKIEKALTDLYKYRHPDSSDGLQKLIEQNKSTTPPATGSLGAAASTNS